MISVSNLADHRAFHRTSLVSHLLLGISAPSQSLVGESGPTKRASKALTLVDFFQMQVFLPPSYLRLFLSPVIESIQTAIGGES